MISVRIYCTPKHKDYENVYRIISEVLQEYQLDYEINRIDKQEVLYKNRIIFQPHIVIDNQVVYTRSCPSKEEVIQILKKMKLIS